MVRFESGSELLPLNNVIRPEYPLASRKFLRYSWVRLDSVKMSAFLAAPLAAILSKPALSASSNFRLLVSTEMPRAHSA